VLTEAWDRTARRLRAEDGIALPIALSLMVMMIMLVGVATGDGLFSVHRSVNDTKSKRAIQAADAGAKMATLRLNAVALQNVPQSYIPCLGRVEAGFRQLHVTVALGNGWCPVVTEQAGNSTSWSYQVSPVTDLPPLSSCVVLVPCSITTTRSIVVKGTACPPKSANCVEGDSGSVTRRVRVTVSGTSVVLKLLTLKYQVTTPARFQQTQYVECRPSGDGSAPDNGC
jgi:hypothetical protein